MVSTCNQWWWSSTFPQPLPPSRSVVRQVASMQTSREVNNNNSVISHFYAHFSSTPLGLHTLSKLSSCSPPNPSALTMTNLDGWRGSGRRSSETTGRARLKWGIKDNDNDATVRLLAVGTFDDHYKYFHRGGCYNQRPAESESGWVACRCHIITTLGLSA